MNKGRTVAVRPFSSLRAMLLAAVFAVPAAAVPALAADVDLSLSTDYSTGDYGGDGNVDIVYVPAVIRLELEAWTFKAVVPYLYISGGSTTVEGPTGPIVTQNGTSEGLGDASLEGAYWIAPLFEQAPFIEIGTRIKFPTGDKSEGLGTGEFDFTPEIELARRYGRWTPFASVGFRVLGDSAQAVYRMGHVVPGRVTPVTYRDGFLASTGITCRIFEIFEPGVFVYWKQAATKGNDDAVELLPLLRVELGEHWVVDAYATVGFGNSSPDAGGGLQVHYRIPVAM
jgi:hypothetical protein